MNQELAKALKLYATRTHKEFSYYLLGNSKDALTALFSDLLTMYINDKNASSIREFLTVSIAGFEHSEGKMGFNEFKQNSIIGGKPILY